MSQRDGVEFRGIGFYFAHDGFTFAGFQMRDVDLRGFVEFVQFVDQQRRA